MQEKLSLMSQELTEREKTIKSTVNENEGSCGSAYSSIHAMQIHIGIKTELKSMERQLSDKERQIKELQTPGTVMCRE